MRLKNGQSRDKVSSTKEAAIQAAFYWYRSSVSVCVERNSSDDERAKRRCRLAS
jgi:hypothetical protein